MKTFDDLSCKNKLISKMSLYIARIFDLFDTNADIFKQLDFKCLQRKLFVIPHVTW